MPPKSQYGMATLPFDFPQLFYIDVPTSKWNSLVLFFIFKQLGVTNLSDFLWDPTECHSLYAIKDKRLYKAYINTLHCLVYRMFEYPKIFHPDFDSKYSVQHGHFALHDVCDCAVIVGIDNWIQRETYINQIFIPDTKKKDRCDTRLINAMVDGFKEYCQSLGFNAITNHAVTIDDIAVSPKEKYNWVRYTDQSSGNCCSSKEAYRYISINVKDNDVYIEVCTTFAYDDTTADGVIRSISVGRKHGVGYKLTDYFEPATQDIINDIFYHPNEAGATYEEIRCVGGMTKYPNVKSIKNLIYKNRNNSKTIPMATKSKLTGMFERILDMYKSQFIPVKTNDNEGIAMTMDGNIALPNGQGEYIAIVNDHIESYPADFVLQDIPFYSIHRPIELVNVGDYVFLNNTAEGRKLAKVTFVNKTKEGKPKGLTVLRFSGDKGETTAITDKLTGLTTVEVIFNIFDGTRMFDGLQLPGMGGNGQQMNPLLLFTLMKDGNKDGNNGDSNLEKIMMMPFIMSCMGGNTESNPQFQCAPNATMNPMLLFALMKDGKLGDSGIENMLALSMMMPFLTKLTGYMGGNAESNTTMNPMLLFALMKDGKLGDSGIENMLALSMMMGGNNPFAIKNLAPVEQSDKSPKRRTSKDKTTNEQSTQSAAGNESDGQQ